MRISAAFAALALLLPAPLLAGASEDIAALTERVERLEGERAVKKLQRAFGYYVDRGLWSEAAALFEADGTIELGLDGVYRGPARIEEYLRRLHGGQEGLVYGQLNEWVTLQPAIRVAADVPAAERTPLEVLRTDSPTFEALTESRRNRRDPWTVTPAGAIGLCNVQIPVRAPKS